MVLVGFSWVDVLLGVLYVSLAILILVIAYKKLLRYLGKGEPVKEKYMVLYTVEKDGAKNEFTFYFTSETEKDFKLVILDAELAEIDVIAESSCTVGGNIVRLSSEALVPNAVFYCLITDNQKTMKRF